MLENQLAHQDKDNSRLSTACTNEYDIPDTALQVIKLFETSIVPYQSETVGPGELVVDFPIPKKNLEKVLAYALSNGTAYLIKNGNIYIWYSPIKGIRPAIIPVVSGWYRLKRFFIYDHGWVKYILDEFDKLSNS